MAGGEPGAGQGAQVISEINCPRKTQKTQRTRVWVVSFDGRDGESLGNFPVGKGVWSNAKIAQGAKHAKDLLDFKVRNGLTKLEELIQGQ